MMDALRQWAGSVLSVAFLLAMLRTAAPGGRFAAMVSLAGSLVLLLELVQPLQGLELHSTSFEDWKEALEEQQAELEQTREQWLSERIARDTEAYISEQAALCHVKVTAEVQTRSEAGGLPVPDRVTLYGVYSGELSACMERELGVPSERQVWKDGEI